MKSFAAIDDEAQGPPPKISDDSFDRISGASGSRRPWPRRLQPFAEIMLLVLLFFIVGGDRPPMVNESHYLVKAKNFWDPSWCASDLLTSSGKAHVTFYFAFGWLTQFFSLETTAWIGRLVGWTLLATGLQRLCWNLLERPFLSLAVAVLWMAGIERGNLAGEWVVGGIEAKVPAYGFVLLGLSEMVKRRWNRTWPLLGTAAAFHVLTGGWSVVAATIAWFFTERGQVDRQRFFTPLLLLGGLISLCGLLPALALNPSADAEGSLIAARIYTYYRISHHLLPADFAVSWYVRHGLLILCTGIASSWCWGDAGVRRLGWFTAGAVGVAAVGLLIGAMPIWYPDLAAKLLRYYWFRLTDAAVPLMFGVVITQSMLQTTHPHRKAIAIITLLVASGLVAQSSLRTARLKIPPAVSNDLLGFDVGASPATQQQVYRDWMKVCRWARLSSHPDEVFLTPRHQQTFKWYAERGEVVNWKDVPQDSKSLIEWNRRFREIYPQRLGHIRVTIQYPTLREYRRQYGVRWMIVDRRVCGDQLPLVRVYPNDAESNDTFAVYELPSP